MNCRTRHWPKPGCFRTNSTSSCTPHWASSKKEYRETLFLVYFEELSYRQAAQVLGRTEQQVTNLVYRGKQQLKQLLEQEGYQYEN